MNSLWLNYVFSQGKSVTRKKKGESRPERENEEGIENRCGSQVNLLFLRQPQEESNIPR